MNKIEAKVFMTVLLVHEITNWIGYMLNFDGLKHLTFIPSWLHLIGFSVLSFECCRMIILGVKSSTIKNP